MENKNMAFLNSRNSYHETLERELDQCENRSILALRKADNHVESYSMDMPKMVTQFVRQIAHDNSHSIMSFYLTLFALLIGKSCETVYNLIIIRPLMPSSNFHPVLMPTPPDRTIKQILQDHIEHTKSAINYCDFPTDRLLNNHIKQNPYIAAYQ